MLKYLKSIFSNLTTALLILLATLFVGMFSKVQAADNIPTSIEISPKTAVVESGQSQTYTVSASDDEGNTWDVTNDVVYSITDGAGGFWTDNTYTSANHGTWTVSATYAGLIDTASLTVNAALDHWQLSSNLSAQTAGTPFSISVAPIDSAGEIISNYDWSDATNYPTFSGLSILGLNTPKYKFVSSNLGVATFEVTAYKAEASRQITAVLGNATGATNQFNINHAAPESLAISPSLTTISLGSSQAYYAISHDTYGNSWRVDSTDGLTLSIVESEAGGTWNHNVYTPEKAGVWTVRASYAGFTHDGILHVETGEIVSLGITPADLHLANADQSQDYQVFAYDKDGNSWDVTRLAEFSTLDPKGLFDGNTYHAGEVGTWQIEAKVQDVIGITFVTVDGPGRPVSIEIVNLATNNQIEKNLIYRFEGKLYDSDGNEVDTEDIDWEVIFGNGTGVIDKNGAFEGIKPGTVTVVARYQDLEVLYTFEVIAKLEDNSSSDYNTESTSSNNDSNNLQPCLLYTSPSPRDLSTSRMPSSA